MIAALAVALAPVPLVPQDRPTADELVDDGWRFLPAYDGEHRAFLSEEARRETTAAAHLFDAAVALAPDHVRGLWSLGHARILLAEDDTNRGRIAEGRVHRAAAIDALTHSLALVPSDPWAAYARGVAHTSFGDHFAALDDLALAVANADAQLAQGDDASVQWLRFKALGWRADVLMRAHRHEEARTALRAYHSEFSNNDWPYYIALAESFLRERDFSSAAGVYEQAISEFSSDHQAYALVAYVAGLTGDRERATKRLSEALEYELAPGMYTRLWLWILATDERRAAAEADLAAFLENPPDSLGAWDVTLGKFVLGASDPATFLDTARAEEARRKETNAPLDDLMCEAQYYAGLRCELDARALADDQRAAGLHLALAAYRASLAYSPPKWKWEWAYARVGLARVAADLGLDAATAFRVEGERFEHADGRTGTLSDVTWSIPGESAPRAELGRAPRPGDLLLALLSLEGAGPVPILEVVDAR